LSRHCSGILFCTVSGVSPWCASFSSAHFGISGMFLRVRLGSGGFFACMHYRREIILILRADICSFVRLAVQFARVCWFAGLTLHVFGVSPVGLYCDVSRLVLAGRPLPCA
jgi:hypothetical protein